jgi:hypothetical protein
MNGIATQSLSAVILVCQAGENCRHDRGILTIVPVDLEALRRFNFPWRPIILRRCSDA